MVQGSLKKNAGGQKKGPRKVQQPKKGGKSTMAADQAENKRSLT